MFKRCLSLDMYEWVHVKIGIVDDCQLGGQEWLLTGYPFTCFEVYIIYVQILYLKNELF